MIVGWFVGVCLIAIAASTIMFMTIAVIGDIIVIIVANIFIIPALP